MLCGPAGVGKTHLAEGLGQQAAGQGYRVEFIKTSRLLSDLGGGHADGTWNGRLSHYLLPAVLILDDFAMREYTTQQADDLYELISDRTRAGSIIVTSNRPPQDWYPLFPNPVLAEGALDRLLGRASRVVPIASFSDRTAPGSHLTPTRIRRHDRFLAERLLQA